MKKFDFSFNTNWPLEYISISGFELDLKSIIEIFESNFIRNLKTLHINFPQNIDIELLTLLLQRLESITDLEFKSVYELAGDRMKCLTCLANLKILTFASVKCQDGVQYITELPKLETLILNDNEIKEENICNFYKLRNLRLLKLNINSIGDEGANYLSSISSLEELWLYDNEIGDDGCKHFQKLSNLKYLNLNNNNVGSIGANYLSFISNLEHLDMSLNHVGGEGLRNFKNLKYMKELNLDSNKIGNGLADLAECKLLETLMVNYNEIDDEALVTFCRNPPLKIKKFHLGNNLITSKGLEYISNLQELEEFKLDYNKIGDGGFSILANLSKIEILRVSSCEISDYGVCQFLDKLKIENSRNLNLSIERNLFTDTSLKKFIENEKIFNRLLISQSTNMNSKMIRQLEELIPKFGTLPPTNTSTKSKSNCLLQ